MLLTSFRYVIRQYGHRLNPQTELHRITLSLERVPGQKAMDEVTKIPRPSQVDDWNMFERHEGDMIKRWMGTEAFGDWKATKAQDHTERSKYRRMTRVVRDLQLEKGVTTIERTNSMRK